MFTQPGVSNGRETDTEHYVALIAIALVGFLVLARVGLPTVR
jgi:hypothetical protein